MAVLICTRSFELKVPSGVLINLGVREERGFLDGDSLLLGGLRKGLGTGPRRERKGAPATGERVLRRK